MRIWNSLIVSKKKKGGTLWDFLPSTLLQNITKIKGEAFGDIKKFSKKKSHNAKKLSRFRFCMLRYKKKK